MSAVGTITKIATEVVGTTAHAVTHPVETVSSVAGRARRVAAAVVGGGQPPETEDYTPFPEAPTPRPAQPQEPSTTEPKAASRESAHHGRGAEPTDDWHDELDDGQEVETSAGTPGVAAGVNPDTGLPHTQQRDDEPLLDPSLTKQLKSEAETMRKASEPTGE